VNRRAVRIAIMLVLTSSAGALAWRALVTGQSLLGAAGGALLIAGLIALIAEIQREKALPSDLISALRDREAYEVAVQSAPRLGELLLHKHGLITRRDLTRALAQQRRTGQRLGEILVRMRAITPDELTRVLIEQRLEAGHPADSRLEAEDWTQAGDRLQTGYTPLL
jgi:hypothetical protein